MTLTKASDKKEIQTSRSRSVGRPVWISSSISIDLMMSICSCGVKGRLGGISSTSSSCSLGEWSPSYLETNSNNT
ncbi:hypothetical protein DPMN_030185 [Dreissena polymorpha]|uniref:Uncharacterized protein n=1 Tax=Dreissena polymorpha TaxID=45954 RepID=A0A9D4RI24_DREPO|nr:hypothetical protein DPMN_030185 [Dreissena polymorpha]